MLREGRWARICMAWSLWRKLGRPPFTRQPGDWRLVLSLAFGR